MPKKQQLPDYSIKKIDDMINQIKESVRCNSNFVALKMQQWTDTYKETTDFIKKYNELVRKCVYCGENYLIANNDIEKFKGYYHLAAQAGEICYRLVENGFITRPDYVLNNLKTRKNVLYYAKNAILANDMELAVKITTENSLMGAILMRDYERAKSFLPDDIKKIPKEHDLEKILWTICYEDEDKLNLEVVETINVLRRQAKSYPAVCFLDGTLAILKLARQRGMTCRINVIELPLHILEDDTPINVDEWKLPEDKALEEAFHRNGVP